MDAGTLISHAQQRAGRVDSGYDARTLNFLNEAVTRWAIAKPWDTLKRVVDMPTTGERDLVFPDYVAHVSWLADKSNTKQLDHRTRWDRDFTSSYLSDAEGSASLWKEAEISAVYRQPSTPSVINFVSTSSGESFAAHITGLLQDTNASGTAGEFYFGEEVCTADSGGTCASTRVFQNIISVGKTGVTTGYVTVNEGSTELAKISPNRWTGKYRKVQLMTIPGAGTIFRCGVLVAPPQLTKATHVPHPSINVDYLIWYAAGLIHKAQGDTQIAEICLARADRILARTDQQEKTAGDKDWNAAPDYGYWNSEQYW